MNSTHPAMWILSILGLMLPLVLLGGPSIAAWRSLSRRYPDRPFLVDSVFRSVSGQIGGTYGVVERCLRVDLGEEGLRISVWRVLQWLLPPFTIPWSEIVACSRTRYYFSPEAARLDLANWPYPVHLWVRIWRDEKLPALIQARWNERKANTA